MTEVKRKTVNGETLVLKRYKNKWTDDSRYVYQIEKASGEVVEEDAGRTKDVALAEFQDTVDIFSQPSSSGGGNAFLDSGNLF